MRITQYASLPTGFVVDFEEAWINTVGDCNFESPFTDVGLVRAFEWDDPSSFHQYAVRTLARSTVFKPVRQKLRDIDVGAYYLPLPSGRRRNRNSNSFHLAVAIDSVVMVLTDTHKAALFKLWLPSFNSTEADRLGRLS